MNTKYYLAYGSNLNVAQMKYRCPDAKIVGTAVIKDYELLYKGSKTGAYLTIEKRADSEVPVAVWEVSKADEKKLDIYEGCPTFYYKAKVKVPVKEKNGEVNILDAFVYIMHEERKYGIPHGSYIQTCEEGYEFFGFDKDFLEKAYERSVDEVYGWEGL